MPEETDVGTHPITFWVTDGVETDQKTAVYTIIHNSTPYTGSVSPEDEIVRSNEQLELSATYFDNAGWQDLQDVYMSIGGAYFRYNLQENRLYASGNLSEWSGGYAPGAERTIQVDLTEWQATLDCSEVKISGSRNTLEVKWPILFVNNTSRNIREVVSLYAKDINNFESGWKETSGIKIRGTKSRIISAGQISFGQTIIDTISKQNPIRTYTFSANKDDYISILAVETRGALLPYLALLDSSGAPVLLGPVMFEVRNYLSGKLASSGTFTLIVSDYTGTNTGDYAFTLQRFNNPGGVVTALSSGQTRSASISAPTEIDAYSFTATSANCLLIDIIKSSGEFRPYIEVYDTEGNVLDYRRIEDSASLSISLPQVGTYYIYVMAGDDYKTGSYSISLRDVSNPEITELEFGSTVTSTISTGNSSDTYAFNVNKDDYIYIAVAMTEGDLQPWLQPQPMLEARGLLGIYYIDYQTTAYLSGKITSSGTFNLTVSDYTGMRAGNYVLTAQRLNNPDGAVELSAGQTLSADISAPTEIDAYSFTSTSDGSLLIDLTKSSGSSELYVEAHDTKGNILGYKTIYDSGTLGILLPEGGPYYIYVMDSLLYNTGSYSISLRDVSNPEITELEFGSTVTGTISESSPVIYYTFSAEKDDYIYIPFANTGGSLQPQPQLFDASGLYLSEPYEEFPLMLIPGCLYGKLNSSGTFTLAVSDVSGTNTGDYTLTVQRMNNPGGTVELSDGQTLSASISSPTEIDAYRFTAASAGSLIINLIKTGGEFRPSVEIYDSRGDWLGAGDLVWDSTASLNFNVSLPRAGTYYVYVIDGTSYYTGDYSTGTYSITLQSTNNPDIPNLEFGSTVTGTISADSPSDTYTFNADKDDYIYIAAANTGGTLRPRLQLFGSATTYIESASTDTTFYRIEKADSSGTFTCIVSDYTGTNTGDYTLTAQRFNNPGGAVDITPNETVTSEISSPIDMDVYRFTVNEGDNLYADIRFSQVSGNSSFSPYVRLYDNKGGMVAEYASDRIVHLLSVTGTYHILISDDNVDAAGSYTITLQGVNSQEVPNLEFGSTVTGTISAASPATTYTFNANKDDQLYIPFAKTAGSNFKPHLQLFNSSGARIDYVSTTGSATLSKVLPATDRYALVVSDSTGTNTGNYSLTLQRLNNPGGAVELSAGQTISASILTPAEIDFYRFTSTSADFLFIDLIKSSGQFRPYIDIYNSEGKRLGTTSAYIYPESTVAFTLRVALPQAGTYYIHVGNDSDYGTGSYTITLQSVNNPQANLEFGSTVTGIVSAGRPVTTYTFNANKDDLIYVPFAKTSGNLSPRLKLYNSTGNLIESADTKYSWPQEGVNHLLQHLPYSGRFILSISDLTGQNTGNYALTLQRLNNPAGAVALTAGQTIDTTISKPTEIDAYSFTVSAADALIINLTWAIGTFIPYIVVFDDKGNPLESDYTYTSTSLNVPLARAGTYYIYVRDKDNYKTGVYKMSVQSVNNPDITQLSFGTTVTGAISSDSPTATYSLSVSKDDNIYILFAKIGGGDKFRPYLRLFDSQGGDIASGDTRTASCLFVRPATAGTFMLTVTDHSGIHTGTYALTAQRMNDPAQAEEISLGQSKSGLLSPLIPLKSYTFNANKDDYIYVALAKTGGSSNFNVSAALYDDTGNHLNSTSTATDTIDNHFMEKLPKTGRYALILTDYEYVNIIDTTYVSSGNYSFSLQRLNNPAGAVALTAGQTIDAAISAPAEIDAYSFTVSAADTLIINLIKTTGVFTPYIAVYDDNGNQLNRIYTSTSTSLSVSLARAGTYYIYAMDYNNYKTGGYKMSVQNLNNPANATNIAFGETVTSEISSPIDMDVYRFTINEGDNLYADICFSKVSGNNYFSPYVWLYDNAGKMIADSTSGSIIHSLPAAGIYYIFVSDHNIDARGSYSISLSNEIPDIGDISVMPNPFSPDESGTWVDIDTGEIFNDPGPNRILDDIANISFTTTKQGFFDIKVLDSNGQIVRQFVYGVLTPEPQSNLINLQWNGRDQNGNPVPNGTYTLIVNAGSVNRQKAATINVSKNVFITTARITPNPFSPDGDGVDETTAISYSLSENSYVSVEIYNQQSALVRKLTDNQFLSYGNHSTIWDGKDEQGAYLPEGRYTIKIGARAENGEEVSSVYLNVSILFISNIRISTDKINPYTGGAVTISYRMSHEGILSIKVYNSRDELVKNIILNQDRQAGAYSESWDGKDNTGRIVPDGAYYFIIEDSAGGRPMVVYDPRGTGGRDISKSITLSAGDFKPLLNQFCVINYTLPQAAKINLKVRYERYSGPAVRVLKYQEPVSSGMHQILWDGRDEAGNFVNPADFTFAIWGYTLDENSIMVVGGRPVISRPAVGPMRFSPYDNPYSTSVSESIISFILPRDANVTINIYDSEGNPVRNLLNNHPCAQGSNSFIWDGRNNQGKLLAEGFYRAVIQAEKDGNYSEGYTLHTEIFY
ncbi:MAG: FlgD immunoglobulin-like domain containing protein [Candidatus Omnitrophica bacterium]|nr:FlgD immunoglobulin-like domain containing protein [Candidatus Omnitrophota bacterium]